MKFSATFTLGTLSLTDLLEEVYRSLLLFFFEGQELHAKKDGSEAACKCKILKVIGSGSTKLYEVGWLGQENAVVNTSVVKADDLICKKAPVSRNILKMFIRNSTSKRPPWIVNADLARKYGIGTEPPEDIMVIVFSHLLFFDSICIITLNQAWLTEW
jgi:hypothetical protein